MDISKLFEITAEQVLIIMVSKFSPECTPGYYHLWGHPGPQRNQPQPFFVAKKCCHLGAQSNISIPTPYSHFCCPLTQLYASLTFLPPVHSSEMKGCGVRHGGESLKPPVPFEFGSLEWDQLSHGISLPMGSAIPWDLSFLGIIPSTRSMFPQDELSMGSTHACKNSCEEHGLFGQLNK